MNHPPGSAIAREYWTGRIGMDGYYDDDPPPSEASITPRYESLGLDELRDALDFTNTKIKEISQATLEASYTKFICEKNRRLKLPLYQHPMQVFEECDSHLDMAKRELHKLRFELETVIKLREKQEVCHNTNILSLPDEILMEIWKVSHDFNPRDIKNLRLTCQRFSDTSSHLLLKRVKVNMSPSSVKQLEEIASHPTIRKGVRAAKICLDYYGSSVARDENTFVRHCIHRLRQSKQRWEEDRADRYYSEGADDDKSRSYLDDALEKAKWLTDLWRNAASLGFREGHPDHDFLRFAHKLYQSKYEDQKVLYRLNIQSIATALAQMPRLQRLIFRDDNQTQSEDSRYISPSDLDHPQLMYSKLAVTMDSWDDGGLFGFGSPPSSAVIDLPIALYQAGVQPLSLKIKISHPDGLAELSLPDHKRKELEAATSRLKEFNFRIVQFEDTWPLREPREYQGMVDYLSSLLSSDSLEHLSFHSELLCFEAPPFGVSMGQLLAAKKWPKMKDVSFAGPFREEELGKLMAGTEGRKLNLKLDGYLMEGTFDNVLDLLRGHVTDISRVGWNDGLTVTGGAEWERMSMVQRDHAFEPPNTPLENTTYGVSRASAYITGKYENNPVREALEGSMDVEEAPTETDDESM